MAKKKNVLPTDSSAASTVTLKSDDQNLASYVVGVKETTKEEFDRTAEAIYRMRMQLITLEDQLKMMKGRLEVEERALENMVERGQMGKKFSAEWVTARRSIGKPTPESLAKLESIDERLIRKDQGEVRFISMEPMKLHMAEEALEKIGIQPVVTPPSVIPPTLAVVDKVLKDRQDLWDRIREIQELLDIQEKRTLKVFPTIMGEALEQ